MANALTKQILEEGPRNAIVVLTGVLDTSDVTETPAIALSDFTNNDTLMGPLVGFRVDDIEYVIGNGLEVQIAWHSDTPQMIAAIAGRGHARFCHFGGKLPLATMPNYTGDIDVTTTGFGVQGAGTQNFTITLELIKLY